MLQGAEFHPVSISLTHRPRIPARVGLRGLQSQRPAGVGGGAIGRDALEKMSDLANHGAPLKAPPRKWEESHCRREVLRRDGKEPAKERSGGGDRYPLAPI